MEEVLTEVGATAGELTGVEVGATGAGEELAEVEAGAGEEEAGVLAAGEAEADPDASGAGMLESSALLHPVLLVNAAGHSTCLKSTVGLSAPSNHPNLKLQPGWRAVGKLLQEDAEETPPYCAPHPDEGAPNSAVQPRFIILAFAGVVEEKFKTYR